MEKTNDRKSNLKIYDDYFEPLSNIKSHYKKISFDKESIKNGNQEGSFGGVPILGEGTQSVYVDDQDTHTLVIGATGSKKPD